MKKSNTDALIQSSSDSFDGSNAGTLASSIGDSFNRPFDWLVPCDTGSFNEGLAELLLSDEMTSPPGGGGNGQGENDSDDSSGGTATISKPKFRTKTPPLYRVILMNDDFTPMDFVIHVLQKFFNKDVTEATKIMLQVHHQGYGVCGVFTAEIAETKVYQVNQYSRQNRHPLKCVMEKA